jgi:hypothetical protein
MSIDPNVLSAARDFLNFYVTGDGSAFKVSSVQGLRRRRPALQGPPLEFEPLDRDPGVSEDPTVFLVDMCGVEDFLLLDTGDKATLVLFFCTDYPRRALSDEFPNLPSTVQRVELPGSVEAHAIALECFEKLESFLGDDFASLALEHQIEFLPFEQLATRKADVLADSTGSP